MVFVVDHFGVFKMPLVGNVYVGGMTTSVARDSGQTKIKQVPWSIRPSSLTSGTFKVTILGEIAHPGAVPVLNEKITLTEALALAGDLTPLFEAGEYHDHPGNQRQKGIRQR